MNEEISLEESTKKNKHKYQNTKDKVWKNVELISDDKVWKNVELIKHKMQEERINMKLYEEISGLIRNEPSQTLTQEMSSRRKQEIHPEGSRNLDLLLSSYTSKGLLLFYY